MGGGAPARGVEAIGGLAAPAQMAVRPVGDRVRGQKWQVGPATWRERRQGSSVVLFNLQRGVRSQSSTGIHAHIMAKYWTTGRGYRA
jgi:hypothetical protein